MSTNMKLSEIKNSNFYNEDEDIIIPKNAISEIIYIINELVCIVRSNKYKKEKLKKLKRQIYFSFHYLAAHLS